MSCCAGPKRRSAALLSMIRDLTDGGGDTLAELERRSHGRGLVLSPASEIVNGARHLLDRLRGLRHTLGLLLSPVGHLLRRRGDLTRSMFRLIRRLSEVDGCSTDRRGMTTNLAHEDPQV